MKIPSKKSQLIAYSRLECIYKHGPGTFDGLMAIHGRMGMSPSDALKWYGHNVNCGNLVLNNGVYSLSPEALEYFDSLDEVEIFGHADLVPLREPAPFRQMRGYEASMLLPIRPDAPPLNMHHLSAGTSPEPFRGSIGSVRP